MPLYGTQWKKKKKKTIRARTTVEMSPLCAGLFTISKPVYCRVFDAYSNRCSLRREGGSKWEKNSEGAIKILPSKSQASKSHGRDQNQSGAVSWLRATLGVVPGSFLANNQINCETMIPRLSPTACWEACGRGKSEHYGEDNCPGINMDCYFV